MPTYRNDGETRVTFQNLEWNPGDIKALPYFIPYLMLGLTRTNEEPYVLKDNAIGVGAITLAVSGEIDYQIPYSDVFELSIWAGEGDPIKMYIGDSDVGINITADNNYVSKHLWSRSAFLRFVCQGTGSVQIAVVPIERGLGNGR